MPRQTVWESQKQVEKGPTGEHYEKFMLADDATGRMECFFMDPGSGRCQDAPPTMDHVVRPMVQDMSVAKTSSHFFTREQLASVRQAPPISLHQPPSHVPCTPRLSHFCQQVRKVEFNPGVFDAAAYVPRSRRKQLSAIDKSIIMSTPGRNAASFDGGSFEAVENSSFDTPAGRLQAVDEKGCGGHARAHPTHTRALV